MRGRVHTNTIDGFWSLFKRGIVGTFHHIGTEHLEKYADEFAFRYSNRHVSDGKRAGLTVDEMRYTEETKRAIVRGNVRVFKVITHEKTHYMQIVSALVIAQPRMIEIMHKNKLGCCAHVYTNGECAIVTQFADIPPNLTPQQRETFLKYGRV